jgi:hypothetical protein
LARIRPTCDFTVASETYSVAATSALDSPRATAISSAPRWLFFRLAIAVTLVLWLPDLYILYRGEPGRAVAVLMAMHLAIALITYNCLVHIAKVRPAGRVPAHAYGRSRPQARQPASDPDRYARRGS